MSTCDADLMIVSRERLGLTLQLLAPEQIKFHAAASLNLKQRTEKSKLLKQKRRSGVFHSLTFVPLLVYCHAGPKEPFDTLMEMDC